MFLLVMHRATCCPMFLLFSRRCRSLHLFAVNGINWYYSESYSVGFTNAGELPNRNSCDTNSGSYPGQRMCWHTGSLAINGGWRCGSSTSISSGWDRRIYQRMATPAPTTSRTPSATVSATTTRVRPSAAIDAPTACMAAVASDIFILDFPGQQLRQ